MRCRICGADSSIHGVICCSTKQPTKGELRNREALEALVTENTTLKTQLEMAQAYAEGGHLRSVMLRFYKLNDAAKEYILKVMEKLDAT